jgi:hypothetical protein
MAVKKIKYPKRPKKSASLEVWGRYNDRIKEIDKRNNEAKTRASKKANLIKSVEKHINGHR